MSQTPPTFTPALPGRNRIGAFAQTEGEVRAAVGREAFVTDWVLVDQQRISLFAQATDDYQWIHVDPQRAARETPYGNSIAHGFLTLSLLGRWYAEHLSLPFTDMGLNYGLDRVRFTAPVPAGSRVRGRFELERLEDIAGGLQFAFKVTVEIEGQARPACVAHSLVRQYFKA